jgi:hypothetical protein
MHVGYLILLRKAILFFPGEERPRTRDKMSKAGSMGVHFCFQANGRK